MREHTIKTGLSKSGNHLVLKGVSGEVELSKGLKYTFGSFIVYELDFQVGYPVIKKLVQIHQFDQLIKAERKFNRLHQHMFSAEHDPDFKKCPACGLRVTTASLEV